MISNVSSCYMYSSLVGTEVSDEASDLGYYVGSSVGLLLVGTGSEVGSMEGGSIGDSRGPHGCLSG